VFGGKEAGLKEEDFSSWFAQILQDSADQTMIFWR
jgi:hypothetical protein